MIKKRILASALALSMLLPSVATVFAENEVVSGAYEIGAKEEKAPPAFGVELLSTGKSDCAVIFIDGLVILSDTADADDAGSIADLLRERGVERIDYIIISHYDKDHIGGAGALMRAFPVGKLLRPDYVEDSDEYEDMMAALRETGTEDVVVTENLVIETENGSITVDPPD